MKKHSILIIVAIFIFRIDLFSQTQWLQEHYVSDSLVKLSWIPSNLEIWKRMYTHGFVIEKKKLAFGHDGTFESTAYKTIYVFEPKQQNIPENLTEIDKNKYGFVSTLLENHAIEGDNIASVLESVRSESNALLFGMLLVKSDLELAKNFGLAFCDSNMVGQGIYSYRLTWNFEGNHDSLFWLIDANEETHVGKPPLPELEVRNKNEIHIRWDGQHMVSYSYGFQIERSLDSGRSYQPLFTEPIFYGISTNNEKNVYLDTVSNFFGLVYYRFNGRSIYTNSDNYSDIVTAIVSPHVDILPENVQVVDVDGKPHLTWTHTTAAAEDIKGFEIYMADSINGFRAQMATLNGNQNQYTIPQEIGTAYFWIGLINKYDELYMSSPILYQAIDSVAPAAVKAIEARCDSLGHVQLVWSSNHEIDFLGYQVYFSNSRNLEFSNLSKNWKSDSIFYDTLDLNLMRDSVYYFIKTADYRFNESEPSKIVAIALPDRTPPEVPLILSAKQTTDGIVLNFVGSSSPGTFEYSLFRQSQEDKGLLLKKFNSLDVTNYLDSQIEMGKTYGYFLETKKLNNQLLSKSRTMWIETEVPTWLKKVEIMEMWTDTAKDETYVQWKDADVPIKSYRIVQELGSKTLSFSVKGNTHEVVLKNVNRLTKIYIIAYAEDGRRSMP